MPKYLVLDPDDLLPTSTPVCEYDATEWEDAIEHAANRKGYVVRRFRGTDMVIWVSPKFDTHLMMVTIIKRWNADTSESLSERREDIMRCVRANRMAELA